MVQLDKLTGVWNKRSYDYYVTKKVRHEGRNEIGIVYVVLKGLIDIDKIFGYKEVEDLLKASADIITGAVRRSDIVARLSENRFAIILEDEKDKSHEKIIRRIDEAFSAYNRASGKEYALEYSLGSDFLNSDYSGGELS